MAQELRAPHGEDPPPAPGPEDLRREWFEGKQAVGVTAGASAPEILVKKVVEQLRAWGGRAAEEVAGRPEKVVFSLPRELRRA